MRDIDTKEIYKCIDRSLELFDRSYSSAAPGMGGWYHRLDVPTPGPSATAVALHSYLLANRLPTQFTEGLAFLRSRQVTSTDEMFDGGWAVNTSAGRPLLEATSFVVRLLGYSHLMLGNTTPDMRRGYEWIVKNQNDDGGWGSFKDQPSRIWLTCMAIRALIEVNPEGQSIESGTEWLLRARDPETGAWGERDRGSATVTHTSFALVCLIDSRIGGRHSYVDAAIKKGYEWLQAHVDSAKLYEDSARIESYNVAWRDRSRQITLQSTVWHPSLPYFLSALVRHPDGADPKVLGATIQKIIESQSTDGSWLNPDGSAGVSVWSVWPFVDALCDFLRKSPVRHGDRVTLLSENAILIRRGPDASVSVARLFWRYGVVSWTAIIGRYWATLLLALALVIGAWLTLAKTLNYQTFILSMLFPIFLVVVQESRNRRRLEVENVIN